MAEDKDAFKAEERKMLRLRRTVDVTTALLYQADLPLDRAHELIAACKRAVLELFPDKEETFDLIYAPRFRRILSERFHLQ